MTSEMALVFALVKLEGIRGGKKAPRFMGGVPTLM